MKLNKLIIPAMLISVAIITVGCGGETTSIQETKDIVNNTKGEPIATVKEEVKEEVKFEPIVLVDNNNIKAIITNKRMDDILGASYDITIENKTDLTIYAGLENTSVDGVMQDPYWTTTITPKKIANSSINFIDISDLEALKNIESTMYIADDATYMAIEEYDITLN